MSEYHLFPGVDENYNFPPEIREALLESLNIRNRGAPMTTAQRNALSTSDLSAGDYIFNTQTQTLQIWRADHEEWHDGLEAPGTQKWWPGTIIPAGWKKQDGASLPRAKFFALFSVIQTLYGGADTPTHFKLPNTAGRVPMDTSGTHPLGQQGGADRVALTETQMPRHQHAGTTDSTYQEHNHTGNTAGAGTHAHNYWWVTSGTVNVTESGGNPVYRASRNFIPSDEQGWHGHVFTTDLTGQWHTHPFTTDFRGGEGGGAAEHHENLPPYHVGHYIIKY